VSASPIELQMRVAARPEIVFAFFVQPELYRRWKGNAAELDPRPGGLYRVTMPTGQVALGEYVVVEPPSRVVFTWGFEGSPDLPPGSSTVEVTLVADGDGTIVRLRHAGLPDEIWREQHAAGWRRYLERLSVAASGGDPGADA
jgi:uncharacterized protein YndB with AHSA1/START domain